MNELDPELISERSTYPRPEFVPTPPAPSAYEWKLADRHSNKFGRWLYRPTVADKTTPDTDAPWTDVFGHDVHQSEFLVGNDFAVTAIADDDAFMIYLVAPPAPPVEIFRQTEKLSLCALSPDGRFLLVQSAQAGNWYRPELLVLDREGRMLARIGEVDGTVGCWANGGAWSPRPGDYRVIILQETTGFAQPAIWFPFEDRLDIINTNLAGELGKTSPQVGGVSWDHSGEALILQRSLEGLSDLHRWHLKTSRLETLQARDGSILRLELDEHNRAKGIWAANHAFARVFVETERLPLPDFHPTKPLAAWRFRRIAGVPCFIVGDPPTSGPVWTVFEVYGMPEFHLFNGYDTRIVTMADHGFQVIVVNARGCSGFGREWREATQGNLGFTELEDVARVRAKLIEEGTVDAQRTIISGHSWGGIMTLLAMGTQPALWAMGLAGAPVGDYEQAHWLANPLIRATNRTMFGGNARTHASAYRKASPLTYVDHVRRPILISAGRDDLLCPLPSITTYVDALRARGGECELHVFEGGHGPASPEVSIEFNTRRLEFALRQCRAFDAS